jgi:hypothetical protein
VSCARDTPSCSAGRYLRCLERDGKIDRLDWKKQREYIDISSDAYMKAWEGEA